MCPLSVLNKIEYSQGKTTKVKGLDQNSVPKSKKGVLKMKEEKKISFWKRLITSIKDFEQYTELAASDLKITIIYIIKLIAIFTAVVTLIFVYNISKQINGARRYIENEISEISYKDGTLQISDNEPIVLENEESILSKIIIDTSELEKQKENEYIDKMEETTNAVLLLKDKIMLKAGVSNAIVSYSYDEISQMYGIEDFNKNHILEQFSGINIAKIYIAIFAIVFFYLFIIYFTDMLLNILLLAAIGYFTAVILRLRLRYAAVCNMAAYSLTLPIILNIIYVILNEFTGLYIEYFDIMYIAISYIYIITAILLIKTDVIRKGRELAKIIEEQERVRQEMERQEEERKKEEEKREKEKKEQEEKQKEKQKEDNKDKQKKGKIGSQPQGDNV